MLVDAAESVVLSSLGWVDGGAIWVYEPPTGRAQRVALADTRHVTLYAGAGDHFAAVHHGPEHGLRISVRRLAAPADALAEVALAETSARFAGDPAAWAPVPRAYVAYARWQGTANYYLFLLDPERGQVEAQTFAWFDASYDHGYQAPLAATAVPGTDLLLIAVSRDSRPVLYDPRRRAAVGHVALAGRHGNPTLRFRRDGAELWADDYDTLLRLDPLDWSIRDGRRLQAGPGPGSRLFIGEFAFNRDESLCAVARPFSGDVVALDATTFRVTQRAALGRQPLEVALLGGGRVLARDWRSGDLLRGTLAPWRGGEIGENGSDAQP
jgi:hypothetical protein